MAPHWFQTVDCQLEGRNRARSFVQIRNWRLRFAKIQMHFLAFFAVFSNSDAKVEQNIRLRIQTSLFRKLSFELLGKKD